MEHASRIVLALYINVFNVKLFVAKSYFLAFKLIDIPKRHVIADLSAKMWFELNGSTKIINFVNFMPDSNYLDLHFHPY